MTGDDIRELWAALSETEWKNDHGQHLARLNATLNEAFRMRFYTRSAEVRCRRWRRRRIHGMQHVPFRDVGTVHTT
jgi:hypothetical protein